MALTVASAGSVPMRVEPAKAPRTQGVFGPRTRREEAEMMLDTVMLDGPTASFPWPLELAEALLADASPWGPPISGPNDSRYMDVWRVAAYVNAYQRHPPGSTWDNPLRDDALMAHLHRYSTQELLDAFFFGVRGERFNYGWTRRLEPQLRIILAEVVRRVRAAEPPAFVLPM